MLAYDIDLMPCDPAALADRVRSGVVSDPAELIELYWYEYCADGSVFDDDPEDDCEDLLACAAAELFSEPVPPPSMSSPTRPAG